MTFLCDMVDMVDMVDTGHGGHGGYGGHGGHCGHGHGEHGSFCGPFQSFWSILNPTTFVDNEQNETNRCPNLVSLQSGENQPILETE